MTRAKTQLIKTRDIFLDRLTGVNAAQILNPYTGDIPNDIGIKPAAELKKALDMMKIAAMGEDGAQVNYALLRESPVYAEYRRACSPKMRGFDPDTFSTNQEKMAFWINLYNALVLDAVIHFGVQRSVTESRFGILAFFRQAAYNVGGLRVSADDLEHGILRSNRGHPYLPGPHFSPNDARQKWVLAPIDARIHFALNCASRSCPPIQVYTSDQLDVQLDLAARNFVNAHVHIDPEGHILTTSAIFRWYQGDFGGRKSVIGFILKHLPDDERQTWLAGNQQNVRLRYEPYDWGLNSIQFFTDEATSGGGNADVGVISSDEATPKSGNASYKIIADALARQN